MPKDYKERASSKKRTPKKTTPAWIFFIVGFISGAFAVGLLSLKTSIPEGENELAEMGSNIEKKTIIKETGTDEKKPPKPEFQFYSLLPEMEVPVTDEELVTASRPQKPKLKPVSMALYRLQIGSFRKMQDANKVKNKLALMGIPTEIQRVTIDGNRTFHRVRTKPLNGKKVLNELRTRLQNNGIDSFPIRLKG